MLYLRHPIDRFASVYEFERRQASESTSPSVPVAQSGDLAHFAEWTISADATAVCRNFQVIHLSGVQHDMRDARATHEDYDRALERMSELPFFGIVELFDESLAGFQELLRPAFGELSLQFEIKNSSVQRRGSLVERLAHVKGALGDSLYRALLEHNALDMLFYRRALEMFHAKRAALRNLI
ncbi:hypothetical protein CBA19CS22_28315 [Caballeronia novacaledonica]|uniref:Uncharacterized protein n=1 Tax=Caballeronia novacaledonica TaxID=1544861 RepID=A0ACB5R0R3_9BURK|nr:hypothetical protein CBA19CS22_28315 [Caballeronia novacaledonica]